MINKGLFNWLPDRAMANILIKMFVLPATILVAVYGIIFYERYESQIEYLYNMQTYHLNVSNDMVKYEINNILSDIQLIPNILQSTSTPNKNRLSSYGLEKFLELKPQYKSILICDINNKIIATSGTQDNCNFDHKSYNNNEIYLSYSTDNIKNPVAAIHTKTQIGNEHLLVQIEYILSNITMLINSHSAHGDQFYIVADKTTSWTKKHIHNNKNHPHHPNGIPETPDWPDAIFEQEQGQIIINGAMITYTIFGNGLNISQGSPWKLVNYNNSIGKIFHEELLYFLVSTGVTLSILLLTTFLYFNLSRNSRRIHMELYEDKETGLYNKKFLEYQLPLLIEQSRHFDNKLICIYINIDQLSANMEPTLQTQDNELQKIIAQSIQNCVRKSDIVSRVGADQFVILMPFIEKLYIGSRTATKILESLNNDINYKGQHIYITASIGISNYPQHGDQLDTILTAADLAMYDVKNDSQNGYKMADAFEL